MDSYLRKELEPRLRTVLHNCYIIDEVLKDFDEQARDSFKESFCGKDAPNEVTIGYDFPKFKTNHGAHYLIQLDEGSEMQNSLGNVQGSYIEANDDTRRELVTAKKVNDRLVFTVSKPIHEVLYVEDIAFSSSDEVQVEDNTFSFNYEGNEEYEGYNAIITYVEKTNNTKGIVKGFTAEERCIIVGLSYNVDVARCLDAILKMLLISMRDSIEEQQSLQLQNLSFGTMAPIIDDGESPIFGRPTTIKYTVSHDLDYTIAQDINKLTFKERKDKNGKKKNNT